MNDSSDDDGGGGGDGFPWSDPGPTDGDPSVSFDTLLEVLSKRRCRLVLSYLEATPVEVADLDELAEYVVEREASADVGDATDYRQRAAATLHHHHLPRLSNTPILDYDARSKTVRYWGDARVAECLDAFPSRDERLR